MHPVAKALNLIRGELAATALERDDTIEAILLAIVAKEHAFILGPPGTNKSALTREIFSRFEGATYFEQLLSKTRPDQAVLGPLDVPLFRTKGDFRRKTRGFLPEANFAFLDETGKMGPTLGHDLLAVLNERILHQVEDDRVAVHVPLYTAVGASNEEIVQESSDAVALWDRLMLRVTVNYIQDRRNFRAMLRADHTAPVSRTTIPFAELAAAIDNDVPQITVTDDVLDMIDDLKDRLHRDGMIVTDRRWKHSMRVLQASAFLNGRSQVEEEDIVVLRFVLWDTPSEIQKVNVHVMSVGSPITAKCSELTMELQAMRAGLRALKGKSSVEITNYTMEIGRKIASVKTEVDELRIQFPNQGEAKLTQVTDLASTIFDEAKNASLRQKF